MKFVSLLVAIGIHVKEQSRPELLSKQTQYQGCHQENVGYKALQCLAIISLRLPSTMSKLNSKMFKTKMNETKPKTEAVSAFSDPSAREIFIQYEKVSSL